MWIEPSFIFLRCHSSVQVVSLLPVTTRQGFVKYNNQEHNSRNILKLIPRNTNMNEADLLSAKAAGTNKSLYPL